MEVMTYALWVLLLMGSVMKNYMVAATVPKTGQVVVANGTAFNVFSYENTNNENAEVLEHVIVSTFNRQNFSWVDTS
jgi:hypothetical protein